MKTTRTSSEVAIVMYVIIDVFITFLVVRGIYYSLKMGYSRTKLVLGCAFYGR